MQQTDNTFFSPSVSLFSSRFSVSAFDLAASFRFRLLCKRCQRTIADTPPSPWPPPRRFGVLFAVSALVRKVVSIYLFISPLCSCSCSCTVRAALAYSRGVEGRGGGGATTVSLMFDWAWSERKREIEREGGVAALDVNDLAAKRVLSPQPAGGLRGESQYSCRLQQGFVCTVGQRR